MLHFQVTLHYRGKSEQELQQDLKQKPWSITAYWPDPHGYCSVTFLYNPGPPAQGLHHPHQPAIKTVPHMTISLSDLDNPSIESPSSLVTLGCVKLTIRTNREKTNIWTRQRVHGYRLYTSVSVSCLASLASPICFSFEPFGNAIACQPSKAPSRFPAPSANVGL